MAAAAIVGAGISIYNAVDSKNKEKKAERDLNAWEKSHPQDFRTGQQIYDEASATTPTGFSPAEKAAFEQSMARRSNQARRIATDRNPNLSGAINAGINYGNIQGLLDFAARDAQVRRSLISEKVGLIRGQSNAQTQFNQNVSAQYGQAIQQQKENFTNSLYNVANSAAAYGYYQQDGADSGQREAEKTKRVEARQKTKQLKLQSKGKTAYTPSEQMTEPSFASNQIYNINDYFTSPYG
jgi:hypothetical protein